MSIFHYSPKISLCSPASISPNFFKWAHAATQFHAVWKWTWFMKPLTMPAFTTVTDVRWRSAAHSNYHKDCEQKVEHKLGCARLAAKWGMQSGLHALAESGQNAGLLLVAPLSEPALDGAHVPVELLGQALQPLLIWVLERKYKHHMLDEGQLLRYNWMIMKTKRKTCV